MARNKGKPTFTMIYNYILDSGKLTGLELSVYLALRRFADNKTLTAFPSISRLSKITGLSRPAVIKYLGRLEAMGVISKEKRKNKDKDFTSNLYTLNENPDFWNARTKEEEAQALAAIDEMAMVKALEERGYTVFKKNVDTKKEAVSGVTDQSTLETTSCKDSSVSQTLTCNNDNTTNENCQVRKYDKKIQSERYSKEQIDKHFGLDIIVFDDKTGTKKELVEAISGILYKTLNTAAETVTINKQKINAETVKSRLMKLSRDSIEAAIADFITASKETHIKNAEAYMLTVLYNKVEQFPLQLNADVNFDMYHWNDSGEDT